MNTYAKVEAHMKRTHPGYETPDEQTARLRKSLAAGEITVDQYRAERGLAPLGESP